MRRHLVALSLLAIAVIASDTALLSAQGETKSPPAAAPARKVSPAEYMEAYRQAGAPVESHKLLAAFVGTWKGVVTAYGPPGSPPMTGKTTGVATMELDGRFLVTRFDGDFMGVPFSGIWTAGFNKTSKAFQATWIDNGSTQIENFAGAWDDSTRTFTWTADLTNIMTGTKIPTRETMKWTGDNSYLQEFFQTVNGKEGKMQQIEFTRVAASGS